MGDKTDVCFNYGTYEQWICGTSAYLYFGNGRITTIQNFNAGLLNGFTYFFSDRKNSSLTFSKEILSEHLGKPTSKIPLPMLSLLRRENYFVTTSLCSAWAKKSKKLIFVLREPTGPKKETILTINSLLLIKSVETWKEKCNFLLC